MPFKIMITILSVPRSNLLSGCNISKVKAAIRAAVYRNLILTNMSNSSILTLCPLKLYYALQNRLPQEDFWLL